MSSKDRAQHFQAVLDRYQSERRLPSVVAGVLEGPRLGWTGVSGSHVTASGEEPSRDPEQFTDVQYRIGSITKTITAVLVLQCRDDGLLDLDDPVGTYLPETGYASRTLGSLLAHGSGMQSEPVGQWWERSPGTTVEALLAANDGSGAVAPPGVQYHYSNLAYALLGETVARLRDRTWSSLVAERVTSPLGMTRTSYLPEAPHATGFSVHHLAGTLDREPLHDTGAMAPAGQLWSTLADLARFAAFLMGGHTDVLADQTLAQMRQPVPPAIEYGLGMRVLPYADGALVGHTGSMPGFQATAFADSLNHVGVVALTNATTGLSGPELALAMLGNRTPAPVPPWRATRQVPAWAQELFGYWHWGNSAYEVRWNCDRLVWRDLARGAVAEHFEQHGDRILGTAGYHHGETLHVIRREDGAIDHLECATFVYTREPYPHGP